MKQTLIMSALTVALFLSTGHAAAADPQQVYGSQLTTLQNRGQITVVTNIRDYCDLTPVF